MGKEESILVFFNTHHKPRGASGAGYKYEIALEILQLPKRLVMAVESGKLDIHRVVVLNLRFQVSGNSSTPVPNLLFFLQTRTAAGMTQDITQLQKLNSVLFISVGRRSVLVLFSMKLAGQLFNKSIKTSKSLWHAFWKFFHSLPVSLTDNVPNRDHNYEGLVTLDDRCFPWYDELKYNNSMSPKQQRLHPKANPYEVVDIDDFLKDIQRSPPGSKSIYTATSSSRTENCFRMFWDFVWCHEHSCLSPGARHFGEQGFGLILIGDFYLRSGIRLEGTLLPYKQFPSSAQTTEQAESLETGSRIEEHFRREVDEYLITLEAVLILAAGEERTVHNSSIDCNKSLHNHALWYMGKTLLLMSISLYVGFVLVVSVVTGFDPYGESQYRAVGYRGFDFIMPNAQAQLLLGVGRPEPKQVSRFSINGPSGEIIENIENPSGLKKGC
ncbi:predicted protein [Histoplasma mississippiense (nom. inval.)]|uniref:predicted protein n=1 Tax=Ajellomyces capsulatus (strain NAm1 / WU24) TaxID=2059318 RepID=UPI000157C40F|nr:predicted protein [Histoplasma mississippiense (nom. inval.)]EDN07314.1 predicted protein [Histoplasma mississippiense (nom. inval.)]